MLTTAAPGVVAVFGALLVLLCLMGLARPPALLRLVDGVMRRPGGLVVAVSMRLVLGGALLLASSASGLPVTFQVLGWLTLASAVAIPFIGRARLSSLMDWIRGAHPLLVRVWLAFGLLFGGLLLGGTLMGS